MPKKPLTDEEIWRAVHERFSLGESFFFAFEVGKDEDLFKKLGPAPGRRSLKKWLIDKHTLLRPAASAETVPDRLLRPAETERTNVDERSL